MQNLVQFHIAIVALNDFGLGLDGTDNLLDFSQFLLRNLRSLVQQNHVAELNLLDNQILNILLIDVLAQQIVTVLELITHTKGINHRNDAVELYVAILDVLRSQRRNAANSLGDRRRFADTAGLNDDIVEAVHTGNVAQLLHQVHLQGATDATVLQSNQRIVLLTYYSTLLYQVGIDVHLADIIDYHSKLNTLLILQDAIQQCSLTTAQITRQKQYGNILDWFHFLYSLILFWRAKLVLFYEFCKLSLTLFKLVRKKLLIFHFSPFTFHLLFVSLQKFLREQAALSITSKLDSAFVCTVLAIVFGEDNIFNNTKHYDNQ